MMQRWIKIILLSVVMLLGVQLVVAVAAQNIPLAVRRKVVEAQQLLEQQRYDQALKLLGIEAKDSGHYLIDFCRANAYLLSERPALAIPWLRRVVVKQADYAPGWLNLAQALYVSDDYAGAGQAFERSFALTRPERLSLLYNAALSYLQAEQSQSALTVLRQLIDRPAEQIDNSWRGALVQVYLQLEQPRQALPQLQFLAEHTQHEPQRRWRELLVQQYMVLGMSDQALNALNRYTDEDGLHSRWWTLLTHLHLEAGHYEQGLVALKVVGYLQPLSTEQTRLLADLHLSLGVPQQAQHYYQQLLKTQPHDRQVLTRLAHASLNLHQPQQALYWTQQQGAQSDPELLQLQGQLLFSLERYAEASELFGRLAKQSEQPGPLWLMTAYAAWNGELWAEARLALRQAQRFSEQRQRAKELLRQLQERTP
ncbi:MAG: tetratricopeptide repeat protein [Desulfuromonas sp.]|nr:tetratricopeptide repeat protein [Desulfuromonas sp.]